MKKEVILCDHCESVVDFEKVGGLTMTFAQPGDPDEHFCDVACACAKYCKHDVKDALAPGSLPKIPCSNAAVHGAHIFHTRDGVRFCPGVAWIQWGDGYFKGTVRM